MIKFKFGGVLWPGLAKLVEECGEVVQVLGKLVMVDGGRHHWSGDLIEMLENELGDLLAAIQFMTQTSPLDSEKIQRRAAQKLETFYKWHEEGKRS